MPKLVVSLCALVLLASASVSAWAGEPTSGTLSVEKGKGLVVIDFRGSVLGRLTSGTLRVTDQTPNDRYAPLVTGKKVTQERIGPRTVLYKGQGLRYRLLRGGHKIGARGHRTALAGARQG